jgi:hypothetical protein
MVVVGLLAVAAFGACDDDDGDDDADQPTVAATADGGDGDGEEAEVEAAVRRAFEAWTARDVEGLLASFTDAGLVSSFGGEGTTAEDVRNGLPEFIGSEPISNPEFRNTTVDGDTATTDVQFQFSSTLDASTFTLVRTDGDWKIDGEDELAVSAPEGHAEFDIEATEFAFDTDTNAIAAAGAPLALNLENVGQQAHELALVRIPADANIDELLRSEEEPPGVEFLGAAGPIDAGETASLVMLEELEPGRYIMVCFLPDASEGAEGEPHAFLGMVSEFTVE